LSILEFTPDNLDVHTLSSGQELLTISEVALDLRCSKAHVYNTIHGEVKGVSALPAIFHGRRRLVRRSTLEQWKRDNERPLADATMIASLKIPAVDA
jgi:excisionase family DNA binding protein